MKTVKHRNERGSALVYILIAIALLAALTISFMEPSSQQTQSQSSFKLASELETQIEYIRSAVQECVVLYPSGDSTIDYSSSGTDIGAAMHFPIKPNSTHLPVALRSANPTVKDIRCPGNPGDDPNHVSIFGGMSGKFLPPAPALFTDWQWYNGKDGVFFWIETDKTDAYIQTALAKVEENFGKCEANVIDATAGAVNMESGPVTITCPNDKYCLRVWMVVKPSAVYVEAGCP